MEQMEPKENQSPEIEQETRPDAPEPEGTLLGFDDIPPGWESPPPDDPPCPCPCPCEEE